MSQKKAGTGHTVALSAASSSPAPAFRHSHNKNWPLSHLDFVSLYFRVYFLFPLLFLSFLFATFPSFLCFSLFQPFFATPFLDLFISLSSFLFFPLSFCLFLSSFIYVSLPLLLFFLIFLLFLTFFVFIFAVPFPFSTLSLLFVVSLFSSVLCSFLVSNFCLIIPFSPERPLPLFLCVSLFRYKALVTH